MLFFLLRPFSKVEAPHCIFRLGENVSIWPLTVIRGDMNYIQIGEGSNVQDGCVLHVRGHFEGKERHLGPKSWDPKKKNSWGKHLIVLKWKSVSPNWFYLSHRKKFLAKNYILTWKVFCSPRQAEGSASNNRWRGLYRAQGLSSRLHDRVPYFSGH